MYSLITALISAIAICSTLTSTAPTNAHHEHLRRALGSDYTVALPPPSVPVAPTPDAPSAPLAPSDPSAPSQPYAPSASSIPTTPSAPTSNSDSSAKSSVDGDLADYAEPSQPFEDGVHDCSSVPSGQGVIPVDWIDGLKGGWTSIMNTDGGTSPTCQDGYYCSYACQAGMSKTQYPVDFLPASGISVGGLKCVGGKLYRSNPAEQNLCVWGKKNVQFHSLIGKDVALCRTDYPGSENMNVATLLKAGQSKPATVVDGDTYYKHNGGKTSAQYYVNNAGVSVQQGCIWGTPGSGIGNWAPVVLGSGTVGGKTYLSLIPNPNNLQAPNYNVKIVGLPGSVVNGDCKYENGAYNGHGTDGCTVTVDLGNAVFEFY